MQLKYSKMKIFHFMEKIKSLPNTNSQILAPLHIRIKPTNVCNHNCSYCAYRTDHLQLGKNMNIQDIIPKNKMFEIIEDLEEMGVKAITFSGGGEPFIYPYFLETLQKLSQTNIKFAALTNGSKLKGEVAEIFSKYGTWLRISIDGWDDESYSCYRNISDKKFSKLMANIYNFSKMNSNCYLGVCIIVDHKNASHIFELTQRLKDNGIQGVKIAPCIISNDGNKNNQYHQSIANTVRNQINNSIEKLDGNNFEIFDSYHTQLETFEKQYKWCPYIQILPVIGADCNIYSCHDKAYNLDNGIIGSIKELRFKTVWLSDKNNFFKIDPSIDCNHHCVVNNHNNMLLEFLNIDKNHLTFV